MLKEKGEQEIFLSLLALGKIFIEFFVSRGLCLLF